MFQEFLLERVLPPAADPVDEVSERILDAAVAEMQEFGIRRMSIDAVVRRSGASRTTVYRRYPGKDALVTAVLEREVRHLFERVTASLPEEGTLAERVAEIFATGVGEAISHPLLTRLLHTDPEAVLPFLTIHSGPLIDLGRRFVETAITADPAAESLEPARIADATEALVRIGHTYMLEATASSRPSRERLRELAVTLTTPLLTPEGQLA
jgi:AcrR family transcriptional regulator